MNKEIFKTLNKEQMIVAFSQLKDDYHNLFKQHEKTTRKYKKFKKNICKLTMYWEREDLPDDDIVISLIETLVDEVSRLEDIEDKKVEVAVDFIEEKRDKFWEDKIMAKIEELEQKAEEMKYDYDVSYAEEDLFNKNVKFFKEQMQKLLEEN